MNVVGKILTRITFGAKVLSLQNFEYYIMPLKRQPHKMVKHTPVADELFECLLPFAGLAVKRLLSLKVVALFVLRQRITLKWAIPLHL